MKAQNNILYLPIQKKWFDLIRLGVKNEEYRAISPYYTSRLIHSFALGVPIYKKYDFVRFTNGDGNHRPQVCCEFLSVSISEFGTPAWGFKEKCFVIKLGAVVSAVNLILPECASPVEFY